jgi:hypothetical protein
MSTVNQQVTTVGYGDLVPQSVFGKLVAAVAMVTGVVGMAAIISIVSSEMNALRTRAQTADSGGVRQAGLGLAAAASLAEPAGLAPLSAVGGGGGKEELRKHVKLLREMLSQPKQVSAAEAACLQVLQDTALGALDAYLGVLAQDNGSSAELPLAMAQPLE